MADDDGLPPLEDALPGAAQALRRAVQHAAEPGAEDAVRAALLRLLEAAGGPDVGNAARTHLERGGRVTVPEASADAVLHAARQLHAAATAQLRGTLLRAGLAAAGADGPAGGRRAERAAWAGRRLAARDAAVAAVLDRLGRPAAEAEPRGRPG